MDTKVVITGTGVVTPVGNDVDTYWRALCAGQSGVRAVDFDTEGIPAKIAGIAPDVTPTGMEPKEVRRLSRFILFALEAADQAWAQSGLDIEHEDPYRCGVALGTGIGGIEDIYENSITMKERGARRVSPLFLPRGLTNMAAGQVAIRHGLQGVNKNIVTACAAGSQSIISGVESLRLGRADVMVVGGSESGVIPFGLAGFCSLRALSTKRNDTPTAASRPFDADRDGFVMGEGAGVLILESEAHAKARGAEILAQVAGVGESCDAYHVVAPRPDGSGPATAMRTALADAKIAPEKIDYCNAHGTSTKLNDVSESLALKQVFGAQTPPVSSTKSMIGHCLGAAGAVEAVACIQTLRTDCIHPNINYENPDPECNINIVVGDARQQKVEFALSNSLGFGGHNASLIFKRYA